MRHTTKAMLALFVASLMIVSAGAVFFTDEGTSIITPVEQKIDNDYVKVLKDGSGIKLYLPVDKKGESIRGITTNGVDTVTIQGAYYTTTASCAFFVDSGISGLNMVVVGSNPEKPNNFLCENYNEESVSCMVFGSPVKITGVRDSYGIGSLALTAQGNDAIGIDKHGDLYLENVSLDINLTLKRGSQGFLNNEAYGITATLGRLDLNTAAISVTCNNCGGDFYGLTVDTATHGSNMSVSARSCFVKHMVGVTINEKIENLSRISTVNSNVNGEGNYAIGVMLQNPNVKLTDSKIMQNFNSTGYSNEGALSIGLYTESLSDTPIINNSISTQLCGDDFVACYGSLDNPQPFDTSSLFSSNTVVKGNKETGKIAEYPDLIEGTIGPEYKQIKTSLKHYVSYDLNGADGTAPQTDYVDNGEEFTVRDINVTRNGYTFGGWTDGENIYMPGTVLTMGGYDDIVLKAVWNDDNTNNIPTIAICAMLALLAIIGIVLFYYGRRTN